MTGILDRMFANNGFSDRLSIRESVMKRWQGIAVTALCWAAAGSAHAFVIATKTESPLFTDDQLRSATLAAAASVGSNVPDDPNVKIFVSSKGRLVKQGVAGNYVYIHRVELRRAFNAGVAPYPYAGWIPIDSYEFYGIGSPEEARAKLDETLRTYFTKLKATDPAKGFQ